MKKEELEEYQKIKKEIKLLERQIEREEDKEIPVVLGTVRGSMRNFPYIEKQTVVHMYDPVMSDIIDKSIQMKKKKKEELEYIVNETETYINEISDNELRMIFTMYYIEELKQEEIANILGYERSTIAKKIAKGLKRLQKK